MPVGYDIFMHALSYKSFHSIAVRDTEREMSSCAMEATIGKAVCDCVCHLQSDNV